MGITTFLSDILAALPNTFIPIFVAIDVFAVLVIYLALSAKMDAEMKRRTIRQSVITALFVSLVFMVLGKSIFSILGISVDDFKVAGGLLLLVLSIQDLTRGERRPKASGTVGIVPIAVPLMIGPAVLTTLLVLIDIYGALPTVVALVLNLLIVWLALLGAQTIIRFLGESAINALSKIMALLLASIAVMMIRLGIEGLSALH